MLSFNELYITEDGKNLVIDVSVDDLAAYSECYINKITVNTAERHCTSKSSIDVFSGSTGIIYVDINGDGVISESDIEQIDWLQSMMHRVVLTEKTSKYDLNGDGVVDLKDIADIINAILNSTTQNPAPLIYDINGDKEVSIGDVNIFIDLIKELIGKSCGSDACTADLIKVLLSRYSTCLQDTVEPKVEGVMPVKRKRLCLSVAELAELGLTKTMFNDLMVVRVEAIINGNVNMIEASGCGWDENVITGVAYNGKPLYDTAVKYASSYGSNCESNDASAFTDFILRYYAFDFALRNGDICTALKYWNDYLGSSASVVSGGRGKGCGCHGTY